MKVIAVKIKGKDVVLIFDPYTKAVEVRGNIPRSDVEEYFKNLAEKFEKIVQILSTFIPQDYLEDYRWTLDEEDIKKIEELDLQSAIDTSKKIMDIINLLNDPELEKMLERFDRMFEEIFTFGPQIMEGVGEAFLAAPGVSCTLEYDGKNVRFTTRVLEGYTVYPLLYDREAREYLFSSMVKKTYEFLVRYDLEKAREVAKEIEKRAKLFDDL